MGTQGKIEWEYEEDKGTTLEDLAFPNHFWRGVPGSDGQRNLEVCLSTHRSSFEVEEVSVLVPVELLSMRSC